MIDRNGDESKKPAECGRREGKWDRCPHLKETSSNTDMDGETYDCAVCGTYYRLYYEDMA